jgi:LytS/YehU family sensor histidine kinase
MAGGAPLALLIVAGVIIGGLMGQPSIGLLIGTAAGILVALLIWWAGARK